MVYWGSYQNPAFLLRIMMLCVLRGASTTSHSNVAYGTYDRAMPMALRGAKIFNLHFNFIGTKLYVIFILFDYSKCWTVVQNFQRNFSPVNQHHGNATQQHAQLPILRGDSQSKRKQMNRQSSSKIRIGRRLAIVLVCVVQALIRLKASMESGFLHSTRCCACFMATTQIGVVTKIFF